MSQPLSELCTLLVDDLYGELSSRVFAKLIHYGRLTLPGIVKYSELPLRHVKHGLVVLIQQHLALHYTPDDEDATYYEANWQHAYSLVRSGKFTQIIEDRYGEASGGIASNLLLLGHTRVEDLADAYGVRKKKKKGKNTSNLNGHVPAYADEGDHITSLAQLHAKLKELEQAGYIIRVNERHFRPAGDIQAEAERVVRGEWMKENPRDAISKKQPDVEEKVMKLKRKWRDSDLESRTPSARLNMQNFLALFPDEPESPARKKRKVNGNRGAKTIESESESDDAGTKDNAIDDDAVYRINTEKCEVALRNQRLARYADDYIGDGTAKVFEALLRCLEDEILRCKDDLAMTANEEVELSRAPWAATTAVMLKLDPKVDLSFGDEPDKKPSTTSVNGLKAQTHTTNDASATTPDVNPEQDRLQLVEQHLELLALDPNHFTMHAGRGKWKVPFRALARQVLQHDLERTIKDQFGDYAHVAARVLRDKGKLDEKQICALTLLRPRDVRGTLSHMQQAGYLENQEIPKDASRQPSRTMYLWFFDEDRCRQLVLTDTYKSMSRILQRIRAEKSVVQTVIDKAERLDVIGHEDEYLTTVEKNALRGWMESEEQLLAQLARQDELVAVLRDYPMPYIPPGPPREDDTFAF